MIELEFFLFFVKLLMSLPLSNAANIFCIFPNPVRSHQLPALALTQALAARGHNLFVISAMPPKDKIINRMDVDLSFISDHLYYKAYNEMLLHESFKSGDVYRFEDNFFNNLDFINGLIYNYSHIPYLIGELKARNVKYDLLIYEPMLVSSLLGFVDIIGNPPSIALWPGPRISYIDKMVGNPILSSHMPASTLPLGDRMSFQERFVNFIFELFTIFFVELRIASINEKYMHNYFGNVKRKIWELESNSSLLMIATDFTTSYAHPVQPNTKYVGPLHPRYPEGPLPSFIQEWLDGSDEGVIYVSLGRDVVISALDNYIEYAFVEAFKLFPGMRVLWEWETEYNPQLVVRAVRGDAVNILVSDKWLPQHTVLDHPKVRIFITQGSLYSFEEAIYFGVPIMAIPMSADQDYCTKKMVDAGLGVMLHFSSLTYESIYYNIRDLLANESYEENMLAYQDLSLDTPMSSTDTAVWWVEYVIRHNGAPHLRPASLDLPWYQYYMLDIFSVVIIFISTVACIFWFIIKKIIKFLIFKNVTSRKLEPKNKTD